MMDGELVLADRRAVEEIAARAAAANRVALDTEFFWERTYAPQLCLVQVAVDEHVALVDPLEGAPLEPIAELVADPNVEVVMHAPAGDLLAFGLRYGVKPTRVVDTQLLAGFVGLTASASLDRLVDAVLKTQLHHDESFSDWRRRPLTPVQCRYAADDVRYLIPLVDRLFERLDQRGRRAWAEAEMSRRYADGEDVVPDPQRAWRKVQRRGKLAPRQLAVLRAVSAWREETARRRDIPASWLVEGSDADRARPPGPADRGGGAAHPRHRQVAPGGRRADPARRGGRGPGGRAAARRARAGPRRHAARRRRRRASPARCTACGRWTPASRRSSSPPGPSWSASWRPSSPATTRPSTRWARAGGASSSATS